MKEAGELRPLNQPRPIRVEVGPDRLPTAVYTPRRVPVDTIREQWRIHDEWWRHPVARWYFEVVLEDGRCLTIFQDMLTRQWYRQSA